MSFSVITYAMAKQHTDQAIVEAQMGGLNAGGVWSEEQEYKKNTIVTKDGKIYIAIQDVPAGIALNNTSYWTIFLQGVGGTEQDGEQNFATKEYVNSAIKSAILDSWEVAI